jgi:hypothetical protein
MSKSTDTTPAANTSSAVANLRKVYASRNVESKDFSLKDLFLAGNKETRPYQQDDGSAILPVVGISSKFVPKYKKDGNLGFCTMLYLDGGKKLSAFASSLLELAEFFFKVTGIELVNYARVDFDGVINIRATHQTFNALDPDGNPTSRNTYHFDILDGTATRFERIGDEDNYGTLVAAHDGIDVVDDREIPFNATEE